ncbi:MAG: C-GCAxxG-C-C family protein [Peptococcaceae bacterium]|nr:C-GCAxxG-C-C family protein [Peptococcaceae bacterium]
MSEAAFRLLEMHRQGFNCSQMLIILGLEALEAENPDLVRAMTGLGGGLGFSGGTCGALTGGVCLLGLYAGKGDPAEEEHDRFLLMINELVEWFAAEPCRPYGGINCADIIGDSPAGRAISPACGGIVLAVWDKVRVILAESGMSVGTCPE